MNIFYLDKCPQKAAQYHCDKHVVKMVLETAQLLSTAHRVLDNPTDDILYKTTHVNHPSSIWVRSSISNYSWTYMLFMYLSDEYEERYNKQHKSWIKLRNKLLFPPKSLKSFLETPIALAMPEEYKTSCPVTSYRTYYKKDKAYMAKWEKLDNIPQWW